MTMGKTWAILTQVNSKSPPKKIGEHLKTNPIAHMRSLLRSAVSIISNLNQLNQSAQPRQFDEQQVHRCIKLASDQCKNCDDFLTFWSEKLQQCHVETLNHMKSTRYNHSTPYTLTTVVFPNRRQEAKESKNTVASKSAADAFFSTPIPDEKMQQQTMITAKEKRPDNHPSQEGFVLEATASDPFDRNSLVNRLLDSLN